MTAPNRSHAATAFRAPTAVSAPRILDPDGIMNLLGVILRGAPRLSGVVAGNVYMPATDSRNNNRKVTTA